LSGGLPLGQHNDKHWFGEILREAGPPREENEATLITMNAKGRSAKIWTTAAVAAHAAIALILPLRMAMADSSDSSERAVTVTAAKNVCFENTISVSGVVAPKKEVLVRPDREGLQILQINAQAGDTVRSGQVLARLIPPEQEELSCGVRDDESSSRFSAGAS
jgi:hypothetical protein